jgi:CRISPR system Cascade subunit CasE
MNYYFSRARIKPGSIRSILKQTGDAYREHALVWQLFPGDGEVRDFLFRADIDEQGAPVYYVVSRREPTLHDALVVETRPYDPQLQEGELVRFDLRVNPTITESKTRKRHDILMHAKYQARAEGLSPAKIAECVETTCRQWLAERSMGLRILLDPNDLPNGLADSLVVSRYQQHHIRARKHEKQLMFSSVDYSGIAEVTDPDALRKTLFGGVGRSKAFGCGLLLLRRI